MASAAAMRAAEKIITSIRIWNGSGDVSGAARIIDAECAPLVEVLRNTDCCCSITNNPSRMSSAALESGAQYELLHECSRCAALSDWQTAQKGVSE